MGVSCSSGIVVNASEEEKQRHRAIERILKKEKKERIEPCKVLMISNDDSSKAAFLEQLHFHTGTSAFFSENEREAYRRHIFCSIMDALWEVLDSISNLGLRLSPENEVYAELVDRAPDIRGHEPYPQEYHNALKALCNDASVKTMLNDRLQDGVATTVPKYLVYFLADLDRIFDITYQPTDRDIINCPYLPTQGVIETVIPPLYDFKFIDLGPQKTECRKWACMFHDVTCILFFVSLSCYDQPLPKDPDVNHMNDTMTTWDAICHSQWFKDTSIILCLTEFKSFEAKIQRSNIQTYFPDYDGAPGDIHAGCSYFKKRFTRLAQKERRPQGREVYVHVTDFNHPELYADSYRVILSTAKECVFQQNWAIICS